MRKFMSKKKEPDRVVVTTKEQLKTAIDQKKEHIEIQVDLAKKLQWIGLLSPHKIVALTVVLAAATGVAVALLLAILKGYEVEVKYNGASMCLRRKI